MNQIIRIWLFFCYYWTLILALDFEQILLNENEKLRQERHTLTITHWNLEANLTDYNEEKFIEASKLFDEFRKEQCKRIDGYLNSDDAKTMTPNARRQLEKLGFLGFSILDGDDANEFKNVQIRMEKTFSSAKIDVGDRKSLSFDPDLTNILESSTDEKVLKEIWIKYRDATGKKMRKDFIKFCELGNKAAQNLNKGYKTIDDVWMFDWESDDIKQQVEQLMDDLMLMYRKIHAYVRFHLSKKYKEVMPDDGTIPAHLLGNMWGQTWSHLLTLIPEMRIHPEISSLDEKINSRLKNWSVKQMFELSEQFFNSLDMGNMTQTFWKESILEKRNNVEMVCHASAWDFFERDDFRIKQCTQRTLEDLVVIHHEMGHIQYYMQYANQLPVFREGANPGFHEAIGDLIALSVLTPKHLTKIGLLEPKEIEENYKANNLNYQLRMALDKIVFLPFAFVMDKWRWDVFGDQELQNNMNKHWWKLRLKYQGISPPVKRSEEDFDPGSKYHIPAGVEYVRYFVSHILQFQFYKQICDYAGQKDGNLFECDFYQNRIAGQQLMNMMKKGSSENWQTTLEKFIGSPKMSLQPLYEYFAPLNQSLNDLIEKNHIKVGWDANVANYFDETENPSGSITKTLSLITGLLSIFICFLLFQSGMILM